MLDAAVPAVPAVHFNCIAGSIYSKSAFPCGGHNLYVDGRFDAESYDKLDRTDDPQLVTCADCLAKSTIMRDGSRAFGH